MLKLRNIRLLRAVKLVADELLIMAELSARNAQNKRRRGKRITNSSPASARQHVALLFLHPRQLIARAIGIASST